MSERAKHTSGPIKGLTFISVAAILFVAIGFGWSYHNSHMSNSTTFDAISEVTVGIDGQAPQSLDIRTVPGNALDQALIGNVYETLVSIDQNNKLTGGVAKNWQLSKDALTYTFRLGNDMRFSNGNAMDSSDVVFSLESAIKNQYVGYEALSKIKSIANPNPNTVVITLNSPDPQLPRKLSTRIGIVYDSATNIDFSKEAMGSGPFTVRAFEPGSAIKLSRNTLYWSQQSASSRVILRYADSAATLHKELKAGEIQMAVLKPSDSAKPFTDNQNLRIISGQSTSKLVLALNNGADSIFSDQLARKSLRYCLDTASLAKQEPNAAAPLGGPIGPLEPGYENLNGLFPHNLEEGRKGLSYFGANYLGTITFVVPQEYRQVGEDITKQLEATPFRIDMQAVDDGTAQSRLSSGAYTMMITTMSGTDDDAGQFAQNLYGYQNSSAQE
jgi:peptide/nickel transport system substrate-binding protein